LIDIIGIIGITILYIYFYKVEFVFIHKYYYKKLDLYISYTLAIL
jgi:hypothetical protein